MNLCISVDEISNLEFLRNFIQEFIHATSEEIGNFAKELNFEKVLFSNDDLATMLTKLDFIHRLLRHVHDSYALVKLETYELCHEGGWKMTVAIRSRTEDRQPEKLSMISRVLGYFTNNHAVKLHVMECYVFVHKNGFMPDKLNRLYRSC